MPRQELYLCFVAEVSEYVFKVVHRLHFLIYANLQVKRNT